jgi:hypothetical protein
MAQSDVSRPKPTPVPKPPLEIYCRRCSATTMRIITNGYHWRRLSRQSTCDGNSFSRDRRHDKLPILPLNGHFRFNEVGE